MKNEELNLLWKKYNEAALLLKNKLNRTSNLVGEYAEYLISSYTKGQLLPASNASADIIDDNGKYYQVKARKIKKNNSSTQLSIIRSWDFDFLAVILFFENGDIFKSFITPLDIAKKYAIKNKHQNGWVITTNSFFINEKNNIDITLELKKINLDNDSNNFIKSTLKQSKALLNKKQAIEILNRKTNIRLHSSDVIFSNQNRANFKWWFEPRTHKFKQKFHIILNDSQNQQLFLFEIPLNEFSPANKYFYYREEKDCFSIRIDGNDTIDFKDEINEVTFIKYLKDTVKY